MKEINTRKMPWLVNLLVEQMEVKREILRIYILAYLRMFE